MVAKINQIIQPRGWQTVRDKIGLILATELENQADLTEKPYLNYDVYIERWQPVNIDECRLKSVVVISVVDINRINTTWVDSDIEVDFSIMVYSSVKATDGGNSDVLSMIRTQEITGFIDGILAYPEYFGLDFTPPFVMRQGITSMKFGTPSRDESSGMGVADITLKVLLSQGEPTETGVLIGGNTTQFKINETEKGILFVNDFS